MQEHPRVHLDLYTDSAAEQAAEAARLISLGAERVDWDLYSTSPDFIVLADTERKRFCIVNKDHRELSQPPQSCCCQAEISLTPIPRL